MYLTGTNVENYKPLRVLASLVHSKACEYCVTIVIECHNSTPYSKGLFLHFLHLTANNTRRYAGPVWRRGLLNTFFVVLTIIVLLGIEL